jgi:hypothetical protein
MIDIRRVQYVTEHRAHLEGLRIVPLGIPFLASAAWRAGWLTWWPWTAGRGADGWFFGGLATAIVLSYAVGRWYRRQWGWTRPSRRRGGAATLMMCTVGFVVLVLRQPDHIRVSVPVAFIGLQLALLGFVEHGVRKHYRVIAAACFVVAGLPLAGVPPPVRAVALDLLVGVGLIVAGWGDHRALRATLEESQGAEYVGIERGSVHSGSAGA